MVQLTKTSSQEELKAYFSEVLRLSQQVDTEFPVDFDQVWPLVYSHRRDAVRSLRSNFYDGVDYTQLADNQRERKNAQSVLLNGSSPILYRLSLSCLEYFVARKVREVFEVYRQVFHTTTQKAIGLTPKQADIVQNLQNISMLLQRKHNELHAKMEEMGRRVDKAERDCQGLNTRLGMEAFYRRKAVEGLEEDMRRMAARKDAESKQTPCSVKPCQAMSSHRKLLPGYMTVRQYARKSGASVDTACAVKLGMIASALCRVKGLQTPMAPRRKVRIYPQEILSQVFNSANL